MMNISRLWRNENSSSLPPVCVCVTVKPPWQVCREPLELKSGIWIILRLCLRHGKAHTPPKSSPHLFALYKPTPSLTYTHTQTQILQVNSCSFMVLHCSEGPIYISQARFVKATILFTLRKHKSCKKHPMTSCKHTLIKQTLHDLFMWLEVVINS